MSTNGKYLKVEGKWQRVTGENLPAEHANYKQHKTESRTNAIRTSNNRTKRNRNKCPETEMQKAMKTATIAGCAIVGIIALLVLAYMIAASNNPNLAPEVVGESVFIVMIQTLESINNGFHQFCFNMFDKLFQAVYM